MKLTHIALVLTLGLLGLTTWIAYNEHVNNTSARNKLELYERHGQPEPVMEAKEDQLVLDAMRKRAAAGSATSLPPSPVASAGGLPPAAMTPTAMTPSLPPQRIGTTPPAVNLPHVSAASINAEPPPLTEEQRYVAAAPAIAKVSEVHSDLGFVIVDSGSRRKLEKGMNFALRHDGFLVGRIKITEVDENSAVGDLVSKSVPDGVAIEKNDDVIQDVPTP
jgi:hypothetical protein